MDTALLLLAVFCFVALSESYSVEEKGRKYSDEVDQQYRVYFQDGEDIISSWHDIPLYDVADSSNQTFNMVVEIPRFSQAKFEISRDLELNPIIQDQSHGANRYLSNVFPWHGHVCNYGAFPQTWENPFLTDPWTGLRGDKDPIDVCEVGSDPLQTGSVVPVQVLGILGVLDGDEADWKVLVINSKEADERNLKNLEDLDREFPGMKETVRSFFRLYKIPTGGNKTEFAFDGNFQDVDIAEAVIEYDS